MLFAEAVNHLLDCAATSETFLSAPFPHVFEQHKIFTSEIRMTVSGGNITTFAIHGQRKITGRRLNSILIERNTL